MAHALEQYYSGDEHWGKFLNVFKKKWDECSFKEELISELNGHVDIAIIVYGINIEKDRAIKWIHSKVPALDDLSPADCTTDRDLIIRLRTMLMRMR